MTKFRVETEGEDGWSDWIHPLPGYKMACCDCGLVHNLEFRVLFRAQRNVRSTAMMRRHKKAKEAKGAQE
jgi:hypothetical protein